MNPLAAAIILPYDDLVAFQRHSKRGGRVENPATQAAKHHPGNRKQS
jgi:urease beta subunit